MVSGDESSLFALSRCAKISWTGKGEAASPHDPSGRFAVASPVDMLVQKELRGRLNNHETARIALENDWNKDFLSPNKRRGRRFPLVLGRIVFNLFCASTKHSALIYGIIGGEGRKT